MSLLLKKNDDSEETSLQFLLIKVDHLMFSVFGFGLLGLDIFLSHDKLFVHLESRL